MSDELDSLHPKARALGYSNVRNFEQLDARAKQTSFESGQRMRYHLVAVNEMVDQKAVR